MHTAYTPISPEAKSRRDPAIRWYPPGRVLQHAIDGLWSFGFPLPDKDPYIEHSLPDGGVDIIIECSQGQCRSGFVRGPAGRGTRVPVDRQVEYIGIRVRPGMARAVLGIDAFELRDHRIDLQDIDRRFHAGLAACISNAAAETVARVQAMLRGIAAEMDQTRISAIALPLMRNSGGRCSVQQVATALGWSARKLHRRMSTELGLSPKLFMRTLRLQRAFQLLRADGMPMALAATEAGYADQAHMCRDFLGLTASTPAALIAHPIPHSILT